MKVGERLTVQEFIGRSKDYIFFVISTKYNVTDDAIFHERNNEYGVVSYREDVDSIVFKPMASFTEEAGETFYLVKSLRFDGIYTELDMAATGDLYTIISEIEGTGEEEEVINVFAVRKIAKNETEI